LGSKTTLPVRKICGRAVVNERRKKTHLRLNGTLAVCTVDACSPEFEQIRLHRANATIIWICEGRGTLKELRTVKI
jgi:hypothetical protein